MPLIHLIDCIDSGSKVELTLSPIWNLIAGVLPIRPPILRIHRFHEKREDVVMISHFIRSLAVLVSDPVQRWLFRRLRLVI